MRISDWSSDVGSSDLVSSGAHRDSDIGGGERRGIVNAVTRHGDAAAFALKCLDLPMLVFGRDIGLDLVDPKLACNSLGGRAAVTGEHHDANAAVVNSPDRSGRGWLDGVSHGQQPSRRAVRSEEHTSELQSLMRISYDA